MNSVSDDEALVRWASSLDYQKRPEESIERFRDRFAFHMLDQDSPIAAAEIVLGKRFEDWTPLECAKWVLDYEDWFDAKPSNSYGEWCYLRDKFKVEIDKLTFVEQRRTFVEQRRAGIISSNFFEVLTLDGRHAKDVGKWDPSRRGRQTHWERNILKGPPHGYEEAIRKRQMFPTDDPDQGHLVVRHVDKDGRSRVKQVIPKGDQVDTLPSMFPGRRQVEDSCAE